MRFVVKAKDNYHLYSDFCDYKMCTENYPDCVPRVCKPWAKAL